MGGSEPGSFAEQDPFRGIPLSRSLLQEIEKEEKGKGYEIERRGVPFLTRLLRRRRSVVRFSCQKRRLSRCGVNATGRVAGRPLRVREPFEERITGALSTRRERGFSCCPLDGT